MGWQLGGSGEVRGGEAPPSQKHNTLKKKIMKKTKICLNKKKFSKIIEKSFHESEA